MAVRRQDLEGGQGAAVYTFPTQVVRARAARQRAAARRRRAGLGVVALALGGLILTGGGPAPRTPSATPPRAVVLSPGDTLWDVAERYAPAGTDIRAYTAAIEELNDLSGSVPAGTRVRLPR